MAARLAVLMPSVFVSVVRGLFQPHSCVLGSSQRCLNHEELLVVLLVRGSRVRHNTCSYRGDMTFVAIIKNNFPERRKSRLS